MKSFQGAILASTTREQVQAVVAKLYQLAVAGDVAAARVFLDRVCGRSALEKRFEVELRQKQTVFVFPVERSS